MMECQSWNTIQQTKITNHQLKLIFFSKHEQQRKRKLGAVKRREGEEGKWLVECFCLHHVGGMGREGLLFQRSSSLSTYLYLVDYV